MNMPIVNMLNQTSGGIRFCMPGHKGKSGFLGAMAHAYDITELPGADNLRLPAGVIKESQDLHAKFIGAGHSFFLVNGSSCGVQAAVLSALRPGDKALAARDMHLSAVNAMILADAEPVFMTPAARRPGLPGVLTASDVRGAVRRHPEARAVYLTYPNYYGLCADLNEICAVAHAAGMQVICDAAHAAAFDFSDLMPVSPAAAGCDIWVTGLHKTLPAMNQCAALCLGERAKIPARLVRSRLNLLQTTSPSYVLLASADYALAYMREKGRRALEAAVALAEDNIRKIESLGGYRCVTKDAPLWAGAHDRDVLKLVIDVTDRGVSGFGAARALEKSGIHVEAADTSNILLLCTVADAKSDFEALRAALARVKGADYHIKRTEPDQELADLYAVKPVMRMREAALAPRRAVPLAESAGRVAAVCVGAYPPGIPVLLPGQEISYATVDYIARMRHGGYEIFGTDGSIDVVDDR